MRIRRVNQTNAQFAIGIFQLCSSHDTTGASAYNENVKV